MHKTIQYVCGMVAIFLPGITLGILGAMYHNNYWVLGGCFGFICFQGYQFYRRWKNPELTMSELLLQFVSPGTNVEFQDYQYKNWKLRCFQIDNHAGMWAVPNFGIVCTSVMDRLDVTTFKAILTHEEAHLANKDVDVRYVLRITLNVAALVFGAISGNMLLALIFGYAVDSYYIHRLHREEYAADAAAVEQGHGPELLYALLHILPQNRGQFTHPSTASRVKRIRERMRALEAK